MGAYKKCIVAFLDILGFKNLINTKAFEEIRDIFLSIITQEDSQIALMKAATDSDTELLAYNAALRETKIHIMSDSIVIAAPADMDESLAVVIDICDVIQEQLYDLETPVFLRGAIAEGDFYSDENFIFGKGLVDAYIAQENYSIYPRIIISDVLTMSKKISVYEEQELPKDKDDYQYIDTLERYFACDTLEELQACKNYHKIKGFIERQLSDYSDRRVREKYLWLQAEVKRIEKKLTLKKGICIIG